MAPLYHPTSNKEFAPCLLWANLSQPHFSSALLASFAISDFVVVFWYSRHYIPVLGSSSQEAVKPSMTQFDAENILLTKMNVFSQSFHPVFISVVKLTKGTCFHPDKKKQTRGAVLVASGAAKVLLFMTRISLDLHKLETDTRLLK